MAKNSNSEIFTTVNIIAEGTIIKGDIETISDCRIDGSFEGNVKSNSKLFVGSTGKIEGDSIICNSIDIEGQVKANLFVNDLMYLRSTAVVLGNVELGKLAIEQGAVFNGRCKVINNNDIDQTM